MKETHLDRKDLLTPMVFKLAANRSELADCLVLQAGGEEYRLWTSLRTGKLTLTDISKAEFVVTFSCPDVTNTLTKICKGRQ